MRHLAPQRTAPYEQDMERDTVPPSQAERAELEAFEAECRDKGDFWARLRNVARVAGTK